MFTGPSARANFIAYHNARILEQDVGGIFARFGAETPDRILPQQAAVACIQQLAAHGLLVSSAAFWCNNTSENARLYGCPHGGGGYNNGRGGYYSECYHLPPYELENRGLSLHVEPRDYAKVIGRGNAQMLRYLTRQLAKEPFFSPCLYLALLFPM